MLSRAGNNFVLSVDQAFPVIPSYHVADATQAKEFKASKRHAAQVRMFSDRSAGCFVLSVYPMRFGPLQFFALDSSFPIRLPCQ
jgi:hypothetical protein